MATAGGISRPIQVFLDTGQFLTLPEVRQRGGNRDFFDGNDSGFARHKARMRQKLQRAAESLRHERPIAGFVAVQMREEALAKSYRPFNALFSSRNAFPLVGGGRIGEIFFQCTPNALERLDRRIEARAEIEPKSVENEETGKLQKRVSAYRSELGAIEDIHLPTPADRVAFSAREAAEWLRRPGTFGGYIVELFRPDFETEPEAVQAMVRRFRDRLAGIDGMIALPVTARKSSKPNRGHLVISVNLSRHRDQPLIVLPLSERVLKPRERQRAKRLLEAQDFSIDRHQHLLEQLAADPMVRRVVLPPTLEVVPLGQSSAGPKGELPTAPNGSSPVVGIVDGGVANLPTLSSWRAGGTDPVAKEDRDLGHGTFIGGLVAGGRTFNPNIATALEQDGCRYYDIPLMPREDLVGLYYLTFSDFFEQLEEEVARAKRDAGVRIFNLSLGSTVLTPRGLGYSIFARALDDMAVEHEILFVVSAGNLRGTDARDPWPENGGDAVRMLAGGSTTDERITAPAEHLLGLSVGAVNPPGIVGHNADLPTTYTRRGPGAGGARKPELCHYGGVLSRGSSRTGLLSLAPDNSVVDNSGTSFAAPLVAATAATIDHRLEGMVPRETLIALMVHRAERSREMQHKALRDVARDFVGFGMAPVADACLTDRLHSVTLVFSETLRARRELDFFFSWPRSLVTHSGKCRGQVDITLAFTPTIDAEFDAECLRVQLEAYLHQIKIDQDTGEETPQSRLTHNDSVLPEGLEYTERYLLRTGLKWTPVKRYMLSMPKGRGTSSNWRLALRSSTRAGAPYPDDGVSFTLIMTISDLRETAPIYDEVRNEIINRGLTLADITVAHRVRPRT